MNKNIKKLLEFLFTVVFFLLWLIIFFYLIMPYINNVIIPRIPQDWFPYIDTVMICILVWLCQK